MPAPHRGDANKPIRFQGKAKVQSKERPNAKSKKQKKQDQRKANAKSVQKNAPSRQRNQRKANTAGKHKTSAAKANNPQKDTPTKSTTPKKPPVGQSKTASTASNPKTKKPTLARVKIPLYESSTHILELSQKPTYNPPNALPLARKTGCDRRQQEKNRRQVKPCLTPKGSARLPAPPAARTVPRAKQTSSPAPRCKRKKPPKSNSP
ncbi:hypothetical protein PQQ99_25505 [Paraburkholderia sediminicola]|uniref:hypothetical protein n=1 Tax=Paraburkholderia sediminicola TaxID=458836 RepID=UPI0038BDE34F